MSETDEIGREATQEPKTLDPTSMRGDNPLRGSRTSGAWLAIVALALVLVVLIIFVAQNTQRAATPA